ncbi:transcriptional regulator, LysR family [Cystobacter fuscus DSM 2262]|uniref:Transcriptional regulator, LysR family n=1 Tax=Cystobacter fuscus (strain ATCC 25194 / DSM 2262 / NBRC 100088 / M29) TaxID=1242864 RepID=S9QQ97_CYSF2|nr:LysR family transcriptional regulator [Cystobacter fuscus]EPX58773.1 transcriptional regulator, LysR family [Cystobacter fuscus DSM 2262]
MALTPLNALAVFVTVARRRSFTQAAKELGVSSSAVSQAVRQLEEKLGHALLARTTRSVSLTEAGRQLLEDAAPGLQSALAALEHLSADTTQLTGSLRLSVPAFSLPLVVEPMLAKFLEVHPHVHVDVSVQDRFVNIVLSGLLLVALASVKCMRGATTPPAPEDTASPAPPGSSTGGERGAGGRGEQGQDAARRPGPGGGRLARALRPRPRGGVRPEHRKDGRPVERWWTGAEGPMTIQW